MRISRNTSRCTAYKSRRSHSSSDLAALHLRASLPHRRPLRFESLEARIMLAITVDTLIDVVDGGDGFTSLREAIATTNTTGENEIDFSVLGEIDLSLGELEITDTLAITGPGQELLTIDAQQLSRVLNFSSTTGDLSLSDLTLKNGRTTGDNADTLDSTYSGGGIRFLSDGVLTLTNSSVSGNSTTGDLARGGGIFSSLGHVSLNSSTMSGNTTSGDSAFGGGISTVAATAIITLSITDSTISGNSTAGNDADGGAIFATNSLTVGRTAVALSNSTVSGNSTEGISADGGGIFTIFGTVTVQNSTVTDNQASGVGGGIHVIDAGLAASDQDLVVHNSIVAANLDDGTAPDLRTIVSRGATINYSLIGVADNLGTIHGNVGNQTGTTASPLDPLIGPLADNGGPTQTHTLLPASLALNLGDPTLITSPDFDQRGDGFGRVQFGRMDIGAVEIQNVLPPQGLVVSTADDVSDGDFSMGQLSLREAIAIANDLETDDTITFSSLFNSPQDILLANGELEIIDTLTIDGPGQALLTIDAQQASRAFHFSAANGDLTLGGLTATGGRTTGNNLGVETTHSGGGIRFVSSGSLLLTDSTIADSNTTGDSAAGGAIFASSGAVSLTNTTLTGNSTGGADASGGAISAPVSLVTLTGSTLANNSSSGYGGGISTSSGMVMLEGSNLNENTSGDDGGAIHTQSGVVTLTNSTLTGNSSSGLGGGIFSYPSTVTLTGSTLTGNSSVGQGGGIFTGSGDVTLTSSSLIGNSTSSSSARGGGIRTSLGAVTLTDSTVSGNSTAGSGAHGGGIATSSGDVMITNSTLSGNSTSGSSADGGGIFTSTGVITLSNSTLSGNSASGSSANGGGISMYTGMVNLTNSTVTDNQTAGEGGGIFVVTPPNIQISEVTLSNSIVAGNHDNGTAPDLRPSLLISLLTIDYSLIGDTTGSLVTPATGTGNLLDVNPLLGPLAGNGGLTQTHALLPGSPPLDAADSLGPNDQRGLAAPVDLSGIPNAAGGNGSDMGAYEAQSAPSADFVDDDIINGLDFLAWQRGFGTTGGAVRADGNSDDDGDVDGSDLAAWELTYGQVETTPLAATGSGQQTNAQEPALESQSEQVETAAAVLSTTPLFRTADPVDVAIALALVTEVGEDEQPVQEQQTSAELTNDLVFSAIDLASDFSGSAALDLPPADSAEPEETNDIWLTEELLESVFG